jgi:hypothetical protein
MSFLTPVGLPWNKLQETAATEVDIPESRYHTRVLELMLLTSFLGDDSTLFLQMKAANRYFQWVLKHCNRTRN